MERVTPERATDAIFTGEFDHWGSVATDDGLRWECGPCGETERFDVASTRRDAMEIASAYLYRLHLSHSHLDDVINALEDRT